MLEQRSPAGGRRAVATWAHIINDARIVTRQNIARCCAACTSSKGTKMLTAWLQSDYCKRHGIDEETVADVVRKALMATKEAEAPPSQHLPRKLGNPGR